MTAIRLTWPSKDPNESLDYSISWATLIGSDPIASTTWTVPGGLTGGTQTNGTYTSTIVLSGGTNGVTYEVRCAVTTTAGKIYSRTIELLVETR